MPSWTPSARPNWPPAEFRPKGRFRWSAAIPRFKAARFFAAQCAQCHDHPLRARRTADEPVRDGAPRLAGFASREWLAGLLDPKQIAGPDYFGPTSHHDGDMVHFVKDDLTKWKPEEIEDVIIALRPKPNCPSRPKSTPATRIGSRRASP